MDRSVEDIETKRAAEMRAPAPIVALTILGHAACAEPASDAITRLKSCFQLDRAARIECLEKTVAGIAQRGPTKLGTTSGRELGSQRNHLACGL